MLNMYCLNINLKEDFKKMRVVEVDKKGMLTTSLRGRVVEVDKKGMLTTSLRRRELQRKYKSQQAISLAKQAISLAKQAISLAKKKICWVFANPVSFLWNITISIRDYQQMQRSTTLSQVPMQRRMNKILTRCKFPQIPDGQYRHLNSSDTWIKKRDVLDF